MKMIKSRAFKIAVLLLVFGGLIFGFVTILPAIIVVAANPIAYVVAFILLFLFIYGLYRLVKWAFS